MRPKVPQFGPIRFGLLWVGMAVTVAGWPSARAMEHVTLKNGFEVDCTRREAVGDKVRLYLAGNGAASTDSNYLEVAGDSVLRVETVADVPAPVAAAVMSSAVAGSQGTGTLAPTREEMREMLVHAGVA